MYALSISEKTDTVVIDNPDPITSQFTMIFENDILKPLEEQCDMKPNITLKNVGLCEADSDSPEKQDIFKYVTFLHHYVLYLRFVIEFFSSTRTQYSLNRTVFVRALFPEGRNETCEFFMFPESILTVEQ